MSSLSEEEGNYVRMCLLLTGLSSKAVRALFDKEFPPNNLPSKLNQKYNALLELQKKRVINQAQWSLLFPHQAGVADSKTFDVTLMICLIRNFTSVAPPKAGFDCLPFPAEITPGADIARIKYYRNYLVHLDENKIEKSDFISAWTEISDAVGRLGGNSVFCECEDLKTKCLDKSYHEIMLEMRNCMKKMTELTIEIKELKCSHEEQKDTVPWNIKEQIKRKLDSWKKDDQMFVENRGASRVLQCIKSHNCVTVTASAGIGKTFTVRHTALQMETDGFDIVPIINPEDIINFNNPNKKTLFVIDDLCGVYTLNQTIMEKWKIIHEDIRELLKNGTTKIIASCRLQVYQDEQFKLLKLFTACECNLSSQDTSLSKEEKQLIAEQYLKSDASKINEYIDLIFSHCFVDYTAKINN